MEHLGTVSIETDRLLLRKFTLSDDTDMYNNWANDEEVSKFLTWLAHKDLSVTREVLNDWVHAYSNNKNYHWCIVLKETQKAIGSIGVVNLNEAIEAVEIGYCIGRHYWNQGITSEALKYLIPFFFEKVGVNRIESRHDPRNPNSGKVMLKCGLKYEGTRMKADKNNTGICDVALYGMINPYVD
ncbi:MAG: GNAT family N-acetyltransferase [Cellulosilyticaceae bacterium]